ncbi:hypothetical protein Sinac_1632 [Singulisphaera acidiphila DSM 18658]|uniref:Uncharacterized protein n=1 Tax=Singulisphaera acidiphila (strain ATCC BAA-1392 / DSM 18658 / VKM B-2454 / MOB10) TaxID=886293 RepID=L0DBI6_SINAD|nr:hypothetical protein Sinac_1632 [Singulisphaera acidiphila DSM 18658]
MERSVGIVALKYDRLLDAWGTAYRKKQECGRVAPPAAPGEDGRYLSEIPLSLTTVNLRACVPSTTYDVLAAWIKSVRTGGS